MKTNRPWSPSEVVRAGRKAISVNKTYKRRISINEDIIKTKFKHQALKNELKRRNTRMVAPLCQSPVQPKPYVPVPKKEPINVQEQLKIGALQLKQEVDSLLTLYGGTFSPQFSPTRSPLSENNSRGGRLNPRFISPDPQVNSTLQDPIANMKQKRNRGRNPRASQRADINRTISKNLNPKINLNSPLMKVPEEQTGMNRTIMTNRDFNSPTKQLSKDQTINTSKDRSIETYDKSLNDLQPPMLDPSQFPRRKSKFLKMLKKYTAQRSPHQFNEPKSPAIQKLEKAKEELKKMTLETKNKEAYLNKLKSKLGQSNAKKVYKVKKLSELVENTQNMNKRKDSKLKKLTTKRLYNSSSDTCSEDAKEQQKNKENEIKMKKTRKVVTDFFVHRKSRSSILNQDTSRQITKVKQLKRGSIIFGSSKKKLSPEELRIPSKGDKLKKHSKVSSKRGSTVKNLRQSKSSNHGYEIPIKKQKLHIDKPMNSKSKVKQSKKEQSKKNVKNKNSHQSMNVSHKGQPMEGNISPNINGQIDVDGSGIYASSAVPQPRFISNYPTNTNFTITLNNDEGSISEGSIEDELSSEIEELKEERPVEGRLSKFHSQIQTKSKNQEKKKRNYKRMSKNRKFQSRDSKTSGFSKIEVEYVINDIVK
ncbi:unnamed protein product [Moneuplotes crassus]|uniref:Uncharacterized protein n=1 Tax=Euplotes crassus TaxID=5936 RepID=A0AAD1U9C3_EUPCR|nr:unnamed protein product [Moneuplotes crassus]